MDWRTDSPQALMDPPQPSLTERPGPPQATLLDYWDVIVARRKLIGGLCLAAMAGTFVVSLLLPKIFESTAAVLPQTESKEMGGLATLLAATGAGGMAQNLGMNLPGLPTSPTDVFVSILKSRVMADDVIAKFSLMERYRKKTMVETREKLADRVRITVTKEKVVKVAVEDTDPQVAADMANFYVSNLDRLNRTVNVSKAGQNRAFIERRLAETQETMAKAEEALRDFQMKNKAVAVEAQSKVMIEAAAMIQAQITAQEVQSQVMATYLSTDNPDLARIRSSIEELKKQLALMESGKNGKGMLPGQERLHPAMISVPELALQYARLFRQVKVQETLFTLLTSQYEQAKIAEARDTPTVQVLDTGIPADKKSRPRILLNTAVAGVLAFMIALFIAFFLNYRDRVRPSASHRRN
ncbi:MAG TPA: Wzz/FepE/Etk N-terminal domain-containing protein [Nitrospiraceae bacterium]|nr:Wzz/FepE/Etk N-terminal domain-containing protein [Nitrospiraceae bacterium]